MHTALIFKEQMKVQGLREKGLSQPHYTMQHIEGYDLLCFKEKIYILQSLWKKLQSWYHEYLLHPGQTRTEQTIRNTMTWPGLSQDVEHFCSTCPVCQLIKKERKKMQSLASQDSRVWPLGHDLCRSGGSFYHKEPNQDTLFAGPHYDWTSHRMVWDCPSQF